MYSCSSFKLQNKLEDAREAYEAFFGHYPYCYGYWKKHADMERRHDFTDKAIEVRNGISIHL